MQRPTALITVNAVLLAAEHLVGQPGALRPLAGTGTGVTYARGGGLGLRGGLAAAPAGLLVVQLQQLQPLGERQFLLDGHAQQRVQGLLLIFCGRQLPLHLIQLCDVLITSVETAQLKGSDKERQVPGTPLQSVSQTELEPGLGRLVWVSFSKGSFRIRP